MCSSLNFLRHYFEEKVNFLFSDAGGKVLDLFLNLLRSGTGISSWTRISWKLISSVRSVSISGRSVGDPRIDSSLSKADVGSSHSSLHSLFFNCKSAWRPLIVGDYLWCNVLRISFLANRFTSLMMSKVSGNWSGQKPSPNDKTSISAKVKGCDERLIVNVVVVSKLTWEWCWLCVREIKGCFMLDFSLKKVPVLGIVPLWGLGVVCVWLGVGVCGCGPCSRVEIILSASSEVISPKEVWSQRPFESLCLWLCPSPWFLFHFCFGPLCGREAYEEDVDESDMEPSCTLLSCSTTFWGFSLKGLRGLFRVLVGSILSKGFLSLINSSSFFEIKSLLKNFRMFLEFSLLNLKQFKIGRVGGSLPVDNSTSSF